MTCNEIGRIGSNPCTQIVPTTLTVTLPVKTESILTGIRHCESTVCIAKLGAACAVTIGGAVVVRNIETVGTRVMSSRTDKPLVGAIIDKAPRDVLTNLKTSGVRIFRNGIARSCEHKHDSIAGLVIVADSPSKNGIAGTRGQIRHLEISVGCSGLCTRVIQHICRLAPNDAIAGSRTTPHHASKIRRQAVDLHSTGGKTVGTGTVQGEKRTSRR